MASPNSKHGRYSKYLRGGMLRRYQDVLSDPEILALDNEIALLSSHLADTLERIAENGVSPDRHYAAVNDIDRAVKARDAKRLQQSLDRAKLALSDELTMNERWDEVGRTCTRMAQLVRVESQRRLAMGEMISIGKVKEFGEAMFSAILLHVPDAEVRERIEHDVLRALGEEP